MLRMKNSLERKVGQRLVVNILFIFNDCKVGLYSSGVGKHRREPATEQMELFETI